MATVIGGISRLFQPTIAVLSAEKICQGTNPWYFLIGLRMVTLFFAYGPWDSLKADLVCRWPSNIGDANKFCSAICYNQRFPVPISGFWVFHFIAIIFTVALLKFVYVTKKKPTDKDAEAARTPKPTSESQSPPKVGEPFHFGGWRYGIYIFCIALLLAIDVAFIWTLLGLQLPNLIQEVTNCYPNDPACPTTAQCAVTAVSDKRAILWVLAFCSAANVLFCIGVLSAQCCQSCGLCRGSEKARTGEYGCHYHGAGCPGCPGDCGQWPEVLSNRETAQAGTARCKCKPEGASCCCRQGNAGTKGVACGCQNNRLCPCYFQGSDGGLSSLTGGEDSEGKVLRGDTEIEGERKKWGAAENWTPMNKPVKMEAKKSQGSPRGGTAVKNMSKYHPPRHWRL